VTGAPRKLPLVQVDCTSLFDPGCAKTRFVFDDEAIEQIIARFRFAGSDFACQTIFAITHSLLEFSSAT